MKKRNLQRIFAAFMATALAMSTAACSKDAKEPEKKEEPKATEAAKQEEKKDEPVATEAPVEEVQGEDVDDIAVLTHSDGSKIDLGGMDIIIRNWWSGDPEAPTNDYEEARDEWREYIQETYNFTIKEQAISDWGSAPQDFVDYATTGGDENYMFVLREDAAIVSAMNSGLMKDLSKLDCLDFSDDLFQRNKLHVQYSKGDAIYGMAAGFSEARTGVYFNKQVLRDAGVDPETIYDAQANGTWTWDMFDEICAACHRDLDNDGIDDIYGLTINESVMTTAAVFSNGGSFIERDANGNFVYNLEAPETMEALQWCIDMYNKYDQHDPEGAAWDYYKEEFLSGKVAFMPDDAYCCSGTGNFLYGCPFEVGFVMFPKGKSASAKYVNVWSNNICAIPACYDDEKAWNIAFAWMLYNTNPAGYENYIDLSAYRTGGVVDERAITETIQMMMMPEYGTVKYEGLVPNLSLGSDFEWNIGANAVLSEQVEKIRDTWKAYCDAANGQ